MVWPILFLSIYQNEIWKLSWNYSTLASFGSAGISQITTFFFRFSAILETWQTFDYFPIFTKPLRKWNNFWKILFFDPVYGQKATRLTRNNWTESIRHAAASIISSIQLWSKHKQLIVVALLYISCFLPTISRNRV